MTVYVQRDAVKVEQLIRLVAVRDLLFMSSILGDAVLEGELRTIDRGGD